MAYLATPITGVSGDVGIELLKPPPNKEKNADIDGDASSLKSGTISTVGYYTGRASSEAEDKDDDNQADSDSDGRATLQAICDVAELPLRSLTLDGGLFSACGGKTSRWQRKRRRRSAASLGEELGDPWDYQKQLEDKERDLAPIGNLAAPTRQAIAPRQRLPKPPWMLSKAAGRHGLPELVDFMKEISLKLEKKLRERRTRFMSDWFVCGGDWVKTAAKQGAVVSLLRGAMLLLSSIEDAPHGTGAAPSEAVDMAAAFKFCLSPLAETLEDAIHHTLLHERLNPSLDEFFSADGLEPCSEMIFSFLVTRSNLEEAFGEPEARKRGGEAAVEGRGKMGGLESSLFSLWFEFFGVIPRFASSPELNCPEFSAQLRDQLHHLLDLLARTNSVEEAYRLSVLWGLRTDFLAHFARRAGGHLSVHIPSAERRFWVRLVERETQNALAREKCLEHLAGSGPGGEPGGASDRVLTPPHAALPAQGHCYDTKGQLSDLAAFAFFLVLGRTTRLFLASEGVGHNRLEPLLRHLEGGVLSAYPEAGKVANYQALVEVTTEHLSWLPFFPGRTDSARDARLQELPVEQQRRRARRRRRRAVALAQEVCGMWLKDFVRHSAWVVDHWDSPAALFLLKGEAILYESLGTLLQKKIESGVVGTAVQAEQGSDSDSSAGSDLEMDELEEAELSREEKAWQQKYMEHRLQKELRSLKAMELELKFLEKDFAGASEVLNRLLGLLSINSLASAGTGRGGRAPEAPLEKQDSANSDGALQGRKQQTVIPRRVVEKVLELQRQLTQLKHSLQAQAAVQEERVRAQQEEVAARMHRQKIQRKGATATEDQENEGGASTEGFFSAFGAAFGFPYPKTKEDSKKSRLSGRAGNISANSSMSDVLGGSEEEGGVQGLLEEREGPGVGAERMGGVRGEGPAWGPQENVGSGSTSGGHKGMPGKGQLAALVKEESSRISEEGKKLKCLREELEQMERRILRRLQRSGDGTLEPVSHPSRGRSGNEERAGSQGAGQEAAVDVLSSLPAAGDVGRLQAEDPWGEFFGAAPAKPGAAGAHVAHQAPGGTDELELTESVRSGSSWDAWEGGSEEGGRRREEDDEEDDVGELKRKDLLEHIQDEGADAWRGTQLLSTDMGLALRLLQEASTGAQLTERQGRILQRTLTDLASIVPIGIIMAIPMTPVGHAAVLAAIKHYAPHLFPSAFNEQRLDVARRLEEVKSASSGLEKHAAPGDSKLDSKLRKADEGKLDVSLQGKDNADIGLPDLKFAT